MDRACVTTDDDDDGEDYLPGQRDVDDHVHISGIPWSPFRSVGGSVPPHKRLSAPRNYSVNAEKEPHSNFLHYLPEYFR